MSPPSRTSATPSSKRAVPPPRDQATSTFTHILERLLAATPGATAAALVDFEGETVDYVGHLDPFELKVTAAHWLIVLSEIAEARPGGAVQQLTVRARLHGYCVRKLEENYAVVVILHPRAAFAVSSRAMHEAVVGLSAEAGWPLPPDKTRWFYVEVDAERRGRRPLRLKVKGAWEPVEVMGTVVGLAPRERGYRVRLPNGVEVMLVRERLGRWFADDHVE